jgi:hypothetical protein
MDCLVSLVFSLSLRDILSNPGTGPETDFASYLHADMAGLLIITIIIMLASSAVVCQNFATRLSALETSIMLSILPLPRRLLLYLATNGSSGTNAKVVIAKSITIERISYVRTKLGCYCENQVVSTELCPANNQPNNHYPSFVRPPSTLALGILQSLKGIYTSIYMHL